MLRNLGCKAVPLTGAKNILGIGDGMFSTSATWKNMSNPRAVTALKTNVLLVVIREYRNTIPFFSTLSPGH